MFDRGRGVTHSAAPFEPIADGLACAKDHELT